MQQDNRLITIYRAANQLEAEIIKGLLESNGIPALLRYESLGQVYGLTIDGLGQVEIQVLQKYAEDAGRLLESRASDYNDEGDGDIC